MRQVLGLDDGHLVPVEAPGGGRVLLAPATAAAFVSLADSAQQEGIALKVVSGYRGFERQLLIWNAKARGERPVYADDGARLDLAALDERERVLAILRWSALPGASRHHRGTDLDVCDEAAMPAGYQVQLSAAECGGQGVFRRLHDWLDRCIDEASAMGFVRPYGQDRGGVAPEPWHLSFESEAEGFERCWDGDAYRQWISDQPLELKGAVLANFDEIAERFLLDRRLAGSAVSAASPIG